MSSTFYDVDKKYLGELNNEKWKVFKDNIADYNNGTRYLEAIDHYSNVVFSIVYEFPNIIQLRGYFYGDGCASVCSPSEEGGTRLWSKGAPQVKDSII